MKYEKVGNPVYKFEFTGKEATTLSDIMSIVIKLSSAPSYADKKFSDTEHELANDILNKFDETEL